MGRFQSYLCSKCGRQYDPAEVTYNCPEDGGNLNVVLDYPSIGRENSPNSIARSNELSIWRYLPLLPVEDPGHQGTAMRAVGWTPMLRPPRLASRLGLRKLWLKDEGRNPTASLKDRASAVVLARAQAIGADVVVAASSGNAGAALAGMAAAAGRPAVIFVPKTAPPAKVAQLLIFGARVFLVDGTYDHAFDLALEASREFGWYCRNTGYNPFTCEGKKTAAFEICEQLTMAAGDAEKPPQTWRSPDAVFVPVGDGNIISGVHKGFRDLEALGWIDRVPKLYGVQSAGSAAIYNAFARGTEKIVPVQATTLADSISVDSPRDGLRALRAATQTGGAYMLVQDEEILAAMRELGSEAGVFAEPAGATAYAGIVKAAAEGMVSADESIVVLSTGNGLKDVRSAMSAAGEAKVIEPTLAALKKAIG
jgi:threonine synthase